MLSEVFNATFPVPLNLKAQCLSRAISEILLGLKNGTNEEIHFSILLLKLVILHESHVPFTL